MFEREQSELSARQKMKV